MMVDAWTQTTPRAERERRLKEAKLAGSGTEAETATNFNPPSTLSVLTPEKNKQSLIKLMSLDKVKAQSATVSSSKHPISATFEKPIP